MEDEKIAPENRGDFFAGKDPFFARKTCAGSLPYII
jgi:hypothetical protein